MQALPASLSRNVQRRCLQQPGSAVGASPPLARAILKVSQRGLIDLTVHLKTSASVVLSNNGGLQGVGLGASKCHEREVGESRD